MEEEKTTWDFILELFKVLGPIIVGVFAIISSQILNRRGLKHDKYSVERSEIYKKLNEFYGPFMQLRHKSKIFYTKFREEKPADFSTLTALLQRTKFEGNDKVLLDQIISIGESCEKLIHEKSGIIDDDHLSNNILPKATTHYLILRESYNYVYNDTGLTGDVESLKKFKFPDDLDEELEKVILKHKSRLKLIDRIIDSSY